MPRKKKPITIEDIDVSLLPFQSRTTLGQYVLEAMEHRLERSKDIRNCFPCTMTLTLCEIDYKHKLIV